MLKIKNEGGSILKEKLKIFIADDNQDFVTTLIDYFGGIDLLKISVSI